MPRFLDEVQYYDSTGTLRTLEYLPTALAQVVTAGGALGTGSSITFSCGSATATFFTASSAMIITSSLQSSSVTITPSADEAVTVVFSGALGGTFNLTNTTYSISLTNLCLAFIAHRKLFSTNYAYITGFTTAA